MIVNMEVEERYRVPGGIEDRVLLSKSNRIASYPVCHISCTSHGPIGLRDDHRGGEMAQKFKNPGHFPIFHHVHARQRHFCEPQARSRCCFEGVIIHPHGSEKSSPRRIPPTPDATSEDQTIAVIQIEKWTGDSDMARCLDIGHSPAIR